MVNNYVKVIRPLEFRPGGSDEQAPTKDRALDGQKGLQTIAWFFFDDTARVAHLKVAEAERLAVKVGGRCAAWIPRPWMGGIRGVGDILGILH